MTAPAPGVTIEEVLAGSASWFVLGCNPLKVSVVASKHGWGGPRLIRKAAMARSDQRSRFESPLPLLRESVIAALVLVVDTHTAKDSDPRVASSRSARACDKHQNARYRSPARRARPEPSVTEADTGRRSEDTPVSRRPNFA